MTWWAPLWGRSLNYFRCPECGFVGVDEVEKFFKTDSARDYTDSDVSAGKSPLSVEDYLEKLSPYLPAEGGRVLELGGGYGHLAKAWKDRYSVVLIEPGRMGREYAASVLGLTAYESLEALPPDQAGPFDLIFSGHVWEHVERPFDFLKESAGLLADGGYWVAITPNGDAWKHRLFRFGWSWLNSDHSQIFSARAAKTYLQRVGLSPEKIAGVRPAAIDYPGVVIGWVSFLKEWVKARCSSQRRSVFGVGEQSGDKKTPPAAAKSGASPWVHAVFGRLVSFSLLERMFWKYPDQVLGQDELLVVGRKRGQFVHRHIS